MAAGKAPSREAKRAVKAFARTLMEDLRERTGYPGLRDDLDEFIEAVDAYLEQH